MTTWVIIRLTLFILGAAALYWCAARTWTWCFRKAAEFRIWSRYRQVRILSLTPEVKCIRGGYQPDGRIYPDSERVVVTAKLVFPSRDDVYPMTLTLAFRGPRRTGFHLSYELKARPAAEPGILYFPVDDLSGFWKSPGQWKAVLELSEAKRVLGEMGLDVVSRNALLADLCVTDVALTVLTGNDASVTRVVLTTADMVAPSARIFPRTFHPAKYLGFRLHVDLVHKDSGYVADSFSTPLNFGRGEMWIQGLAKTVAGNADFERRGAWEFRFRVDSNILAALPFLVLSPDDIRSAVSVKRFDLIAAGSGRSLSIVKGRAYRSSTDLLVPVITLTTLYPSPQVSVRVVVIASVDGKPMGMAEGSAVLDRSEVQIMPGEFPMPERPPGADPLSVQFVVVLENRCTAVREIALLATLAPCADVEGRLKPKATLGGADFEAEAARILQEAEGL